MPVYRDSQKGRFVFEFDRRVEGQRIRARRLLPRAWTRTQADAYDRQRSAELYALATGISKPQPIIDDAVDRYVTERVPELKHGREVAAELCLIFSFYAGRNLAELPEVCGAYAKASTHLAPATVTKRIRYLTAACRWAWKRHAMGGSDPGARVVVPKVDNARDIHIDRRQMLTLARATRHRPTRAAIRVAWYSGMRLGEIARARPVLMAGALVFVLKTTKNGEPRIVPMHPRIRCCSWIPLGSRFQTHHHFKAAREAVGMPWLHFHDLRHSTASALLAKGVHLATVGAILGHKSAASMKRYAHHQTDALRAAIEQLGSKAA